jgi:hypothetical protein
MAENRNKSDRLGGEYMIQDRDHMSDAGQVGGGARNTGSRQSEQSHADRPQQGHTHDHGGQQGGERSAKRR